MIETLKHGKSGSYENLALERTANQILHHMEGKDSEDSLESTRARVIANARAIYGPTRCLDVISFAPSSSRKIGAAIVEHNQTSRSYIHCSSAKEGSRLAAMEHLLVITEDILHRLMDAEGITSSGWLPATPQAQHAVTYSIASVTGSTVGGGSSVAGSVPASRRSSVAPQELMADRMIEHGPSSLHPHHHPISEHSSPHAIHHGEHAHSSLHPHHHLINDHNPPHSTHHIQQGQFKRGNSDVSFPVVAAQQPAQLMQRTSSDGIQQPKPVSVGHFQGHGRGRVQWNLGSEG